MIVTPDEAMIFGTTIHNIVVLYYDKIDNDTRIDEIDMRLDEAFVEGGNWLTDRRKTRVRTIQNNFKEFEKNRIKNKINKPILLEHSTTHDLFPDLPPIKGIVDAYYEDVGMAVDWKTGKYEEMTDDRMIQGKIYEMLLKEDGYPVKKVLFNNLNLGRQLTLPKITDGWIQKEISQMVDMVHADRFPKKESGLCNGWCPYILSCHFDGICPWSDI